MGPWDQPPSGPETSGPPPRRGRAKGRVWILAILAIAFLVVAAFYFSGARFTLREVTYSDEEPVEDVIEPIPAPAPAASPQAAPRTTIGPDGELLSAPVWVRAPVAVYPEQAYRLRFERGDVKLRCETLATGEFGACEVLSEVPEGGGFAEAALAATRAARVKPYSIDGFETDSSVEFAVRFRMPAE